MLKRVINSLRIRAKKARHRKYLARLLHSGRDYRTSAIVTDDGVRVDYMAGRVTGGEHVSPVFVRPIRPFGMRRDKF